MKEYLLVLSSLFIVFSCSSKYIKTSFTWPKDAVKQKILLSYQDYNESLNMTVYSKISESKKIAQLEGFKFNMHIFTLIINENKYNFIDYQNNNKEAGDLKSFKFFNINTDIFKILKKSNNETKEFKTDNNMTLKIRILEETPL